MKLSFAKTIEGHEFEFIRMIDPIRYDVLAREIGGSRFKIIATQNDNNEWLIGPAEEIPAWVTEVSLKIQEAIEENEADNTVA